MKKKTPTDNETPTPEQIAEKLAPAKLDNKLASELAGSVARLNEIRDTKDKTPELETEATALVAYLSENLLAHAPALLGSYFACQNEYSPLVQALLPVFNRHQMAVANQQRAVIERAQAAGAKIVKAPAGFDPKIIKA